MKRETQSKQATKIADKTANQTAISNKVICNNYISSSAFRLYCVLLMLADSSNQVIVRYKKLAELLDTTPRTIRRLANELCYNNIIQRVHRKEIDNPKENAPSLFIIMDSKEAE